MGTMGMVVLVLLPFFSNEVYGARQRLVIPGGLPFLSHIFIQPSELMKISLVVYLAALLADYQDQKKPRLPHGQFMLVTGLAALLTAVEPDLGNAILIVSSAFIIYFVAGVHLLRFLAIVGMGLVTALGYALSSEYRRQRLFTFLNPQQDPQGVSYQITQILIALGSGGLWGLGLVNSRQKYQYIPEVSTD